MTVLTCSIAEFEPVMACFCSAVPWSISRDISMFVFIWPLRLSIWSCSRAMLFFSSLIFSELAAMLSIMSRMITVASPMTWTPSEVVGTQGSMDEMSDAVRGLDRQLADLVRDHRETAAYSPARAARSGVERGRLILSAISMMTETVSEMRLLCSLISAMVEVTAPIFSCPVLVFDTAVLMSSSVRSRFRLVSSLTR